MEELSVVGLSQRKESNAHLTSDLSPLRPPSDDADRNISNAFPFALILRLRVLQIVCGISALVMGSVAFIEERRESNLGLGIPAGGATVLAAAASIHRSRSGGGGAPLAALWAAACAFHGALFVQSVRTLLQPQTHIIDRLAEEEEAGEAEPGSARDLAVLAGVQMALTAATLACVFVIARIHWRAA